MRCSALPARNRKDPVRPVRTAGSPSHWAGRGLTVRQIAVLYAALGDGGSARSLRWFEDETRPGAAHPVVTAESAAEILDILRRAPHPGGRMPAVLAHNAPDIAFKTGTSYGFRDAWAAGVVGEYTLVV